MEEFIPKRSDKEVISVRMPSHLLHDIDRIATDTGISRNELINQCIIFAIEHLKQE